MSNVRMLSAYRRLGPQGTPAALAGRAQRHAVGWRDMQPTAAWPPRVRVAVIASLIVASWGLVVAGIWAAVQIVDWMWGVAS
jgi:hypothetical protein